MGSSPLSSFLSTSRSISSSTSSFLLVILFSFCLLHVIDSSVRREVNAATVTPDQDLWEAVGDSGDVTLQLEKGTYHFAEEILVENGRTVILRGVSKEETILDCQQQSRAFHVTKGATLIFSDMTVMECNNTMGGAMFVEDGTLEGNSVIVRDNDAPGFVFDGWAGALLVLGDLSDIKFTDCSFKNNIAGVAGAIWINGGKSSWKDCVFDSNICRQGGFGGAVIPEGTSVNTFEDCEFTNNFSEFGGAVDDGTIAITLFKNCYFHGNRALFGGGYYAFADSQATFDGCRFINETAVNSGGAAEISSTTKPVFKNCHFEKNSAPANSDISIFGGLVTKILDCKFARGDKEVPTVATHIKAQGNVIVERCEFEGGEALQGGSIYIISPKDIKIEDCTFKNNKATIQGGAIYIEGFLDEGQKADVKIKNCVFEDNTAGNTGGAISAVGSDNFQLTIEDCSFKDNEAEGNGGGGAIAIQKDMTGDFKDCTFEKNTAANGGALLVSDKALVKGEKNTFTSNTARFGGTLFQNLKGKFHFSDSTIEGSQATFQGGAIFASTLATGCSHYENLKITNNKAAVAGGGFFFAARAPPSCSGRKFDNNDGDKLDFCKDCKFSGNKAGYGNDYATGASTLKQGGTDEEKNSRKLRPSEKFDANFQVVDFWGQSLQGFIDMEVVIDVRNSTVLRGEKRKQPSIDGSVSFQNLRWGVQPGEKVHIRFYSDPKTTELSYNVEIQDCSSNEVLYVEEEGKEGKDGETGVIWYCLEIQDPADIAQNLTYAGVAVILAISFITLGFLFWKRHSKPIGNASPLFCYLIVLGVVFSAVSVAMWTKAEDAMCVLRGWLLAIGTSLIFGSLFVREWRLLWIFKNKKTQRRIITNMDLVKGLALIVSLNLIVLIVWTAVAPPYRTSDIKIGKNDEITYECDVSFPSSVFIIILIILQALLLAFDCVVAFLLRNIPSAFNESKHVAFTIYNSVIMMVVAITLVIVFYDDKTAVLVIIALCVLGGCLVALVVLFVPKIYLSFLGKAELMKRLQAETQQLYQEIWARDRQISDLKTGTGAGTTSGGSDE